MKTILCFGDSNTQGLTADGKRLPRSKRWPGILHAHLGKDYEVLEEGLKGRTTTFTDPIDGMMKNGRKYLIPCLDSHAPIDLVIVMLGTCEMKNRYGLKAADIAQGMEKLLNAIAQSTAGPQNEAPEALLLSPIPFGPHIDRQPLYSAAKHLPGEVAHLYAELAKQREIAFLETGKIVQASSHDSLHLDEEGHRKLGTAVSAIVTTLLD